MRRAAAALELHRLCWYRLLVSPTRLCFYSNACRKVMLWVPCLTSSDTTNIDQSVAEWLKNVVEGAEATGHPLEHVFFEEGEQNIMPMHAAWELLCCLSNVGFGSRQQP